MSEIGFPEYTKKGRFPKAQPKGICRGCRGPITEKYRKTWCSDACHHKFDPFYVKQAVRKRDQEKCVICGKDCSRAAQRNYELSPLRPKQPHYVNDCGLSYPYDYQAFSAHPKTKQWEHDATEWWRNAPKPEYDHIKPHSEGGLFILENIRLLCRACHKKRTKVWHGERIRATTKGIAR